MKYSIPKETAIILHNGSNFGCHFIIKELGQKFKGQFSCLGENTEKYINFLVQIEKEVKIIGKNGEEIYRFADLRHLADFNSLIAHDLWQAHYQILLINLLMD